MATAVKPIGHEERLTLVEHLDELRTRLLVCLALVVVVFGVCFWQNGRLLNIVNHPLTKTTRSRTLAGKGGEGEIYKTRVGVTQLGASVLAMQRVLAQPNSGLSPAARATFTREARVLRTQLAQLPHGPPDVLPVTLSPGEPFNATLTVAFYFTALIALPLILYQLYAFVVPAFSPRERRAVMPLLAMVPLLFYIGVAFGYYGVLPPAVRFLQNFNSNHFNALIQATTYYKFSALLMIGMGLVFQLPVAVLATVRVGLLTPKQLTHYWRQAVLLCTVIAAALPGTDPISMLVELLPLLALYGISVVLAHIFYRRWGPKDGDDFDAPTLD